MIDEQEESEVEDEIDNVIDNDEAEIQGTEDAEIIDDIPVSVISENTKFHCYPVYWRIFA